MKLSCITELVVESKFQIWDFIYPDYTTDPTPKTLVLGIYEHPVTGNQLMAGINVRLLNVSSAQRLLNVLDKLGDGQNVIKRVRTLRHLASSVFDEAYRTYDTSKMKNVKRSRVNSIDVNNVPLVGQGIERKTTKQQPGRKIDRKPTISRTKSRPSKISPETTRSERRLETMPKRPEKEIQRQHITTPGVADEEY